MRNLILSLLLLLPLTISEVSAQSICGDRANFVDQLQDQYGETPTQIGLASDGTVLEVLTSKSGSWTIIVTRPDGISCVVATGESWETLPKVSVDPAA